MSSKLGKNLSLGWKMFGGFSALLLLMVLVAGVGYRSMNRVAQGARLGREVSGLVASLGAARLAEKDFMLSHQAATRKKVSAQVAEIERVAQEAHERLGGGPAGQQMQKVAQEAQAYLTAFDSYAGMEEEKASRAKTLLSAGDGVLAQAQAIATNQDKELAEESQRIAQDAEGVAKVAEYTFRMVQRTMEVLSRGDLYLVAGRTGQAGNWLDEIAALEVMLGMLTRKLSDASSQEKIALLQGKFQEYKKLAESLAEAKNPAQEAQVQELGRELVDILDGIRVAEGIKLTVTQGYLRDILKAKTAAAREAGEMGRDMLLIRQSEKLFLAAGDMKEGRKVLRLGPKLKARAEKLLATTKLERDQKDLNQLLTSLSSYLQEFGQVMELSLRQNLAAQAMEQAAETAEAACREALASQEAVLDAERTSALWYMAGYTLAAVLLGLLLGWLITRSLAKPVRRAMHLAEAIRRGDLSRRIKSDQGDEVGRLSRALDAMADHLEERARLAEAIARGELYHPVELASEEDVLGRALLTMTQGLQEIVGAIKQSSREVVLGSREISQASQAISAGASEQAAALEQIVSSLAQVGAQGQTNADHADQADAISSQASQAVSASDQHMAQMSAAMNEITTSSRDIAGIIKVIDDIAFQTNLLSLNAAVEAARAGSHGKGFAVVASEVRNLANKSAEAAQRTAELIEGALKKTSRGKEMAEATARALGNAAQSIGQVSALAGDIADASRQQAEAVLQINAGLEQIDLVTQHNTATTEETAAAAQKLTGQADDLLLVLERFRLEPVEAGPDEKEGTETGALPGPEGPDEDRLLTGSQVEF
ncbi:MAG: HAMP domain-containing protein [Deltaproteobacteria bacterium]|nr:HAMP domain-containing protein [Deltaproteobacteria bacterium]